MTGREGKCVFNAIAEIITTAVAEESTESAHGSVSVLTVSRTLDIPYSTVRHIMRAIRNFYPYKIQAVPQMEIHDPGTHKTFALRYSYSREWQLVILSHGTFCGRTEPIF